jgi:hypothetical protein
MGATRTLTGKPTAKAQNHSGQNEVLLKLWHMVLPWLSWIGLTVIGLLLQLALHFFSGGWLLPYRTWTVLAVVVLGGTITSFDLHLRQHRATVAGRLIGPVTAALAALGLAVFLAAGFTQGLVLAYFLGGLSACVVWDLWLSAGDNRDLAKAFAAKAEPVGMGGAQLVDVRHRRAGPGRRRAVITEAGMQLPDELTVEDVATDIERMEGALRHPPGSWTVTGNREDAGMADVRITDPDVLTRAPVPWPGPSAPSLSVAEPFRMGLRQDSETFEYRLLPSHSAKVVGQSGAGKTMSWAYNLIGEGITRIDYACVAADVAKRHQFLGPLEPALHLPLAVEPEQAVALLEALKRARLARCDYLARKHMTEWRPGCGLTYLDAFFEEAPDILALLDRKQVEELWVSLLRNVRSAGMRVDSSQQSVHHTQVAVVARAQQGNVCFGVADRREAELGLSDTQRERGARPQLWGASFPGMCVVDTVTVPDADKALPVRLYSWGRDSRRIAAHAAEYQAKDRPMDACTMDALLAAPGPSPTSGVRNVGRRHDKARDPDAKPPPHAALAELRAVITAWRDGGKAQCTVRELMGSGVCERAGRSRSWLYGTDGAMSVLEDQGLVKYLGDRPKKRWAILPAPEAPPKPPAWDLLPPEEEDEHDG